MISQPPTSSPSSAPESQTLRMLIYTNGEAIGDAGISLPMIFALKKAVPGIHLTWLTEYGTTLETLLGPLMDGVIDAFVSFRADRESPVKPLPKSFYQQRFDVVIDVRRRPSSTLWLRFKTNHRCFISPAWNYAFSDRKPTKGAEISPLMLGKLMELASLAAGRDLQPEPLRLANTQWGDTAKRLLPDGPEYVGFIPGASLVFKRWPIDRFIGLARHAETMSLTPVFIIGPGETELLPELQAALPNALYPLSDPAAKTLGPALTIALAERMTVCVGNDGGGLNLCATSTPNLIVLFRAEKVRKKYTPTIPRTVALSPEDFGAPVPKGYEGNINGIPLEPVKDALSRLLDDIRR